MDNPTEICGFIHNISPLKKSSKSTYFDLVVQTADDTNIRAICFSPKKQSDLQTRSKASSPVKLTNFRIQENGHSKTILMDNRGQVAETKVSFSPKAIPQTDNIASLSGVHLQQVITLKAKVTHMGATKKQSPQAMV